MQIILLSGGSGKRLWPLSNEVRSKQFLRLFQDDEGNRESMVQRVYRQITQEIPSAHLTIATGRTQRSATLNQLAGKVNICLEPCRRDTFPAITLAASYLKDVLGVGEDEAVVVCPVDPYVQDSYYQTIGRMEEMILRDTANLTLLGITPTYPSEKYGYIIPEYGAPLAPVKLFREKPSVKDAKEYLRQGALWNAGVFGFRLGYLIQKSHEMIDYTDYQDLLKKYDTLTGISFDYAVAENEPKIQVMTYAGMWRDVGTWNMMAEVMDEHIIGPAVMDETCINTHVINALDVPILCMGITNCIVAVSGDGILISDKYQSGYMKPYVDKLSLHARFAERSWGTFRVLDEQPGCLTAKLNLRAGKHMTYHSHELRREVWTVLSGRGKAIIDGKKIPLGPGDTIEIPVAQAHTIIGDTDMQLLEVQIGSEIIYEDKNIFDLENV